MMQMKLDCIRLWACLCVLAHQIHHLSAAKILLMPMPHYSHMNLFRVPGQALIQDGHEVWMLTVKTFEEKVQKAGIKGVYYGAEEYSQMEEKIENMATGLVTGKLSFPTFAREVLLYHIDRIVKQILSDGQLFDELSAQKFDLVIIDGFIPFRGAFALPYKLGVRYITISALVDPWSAGVPAMPSFEPVQVVPYSADMSFPQRFLNTIVYSVLAFRGFITPLTGTDEYVKNYVPEKPSKTSEELHGESELFLMVLETHCLDYPRVTAPHFIYIGGSSILKPKPLPADLEKFVNAADHGVIVLSFGSAKGYINVVEFISPRLFEAFSKIKQRVIMPCDAMKHSDVPDNVKCVDWLPQNDLLGHKKTVLFIAHGGNNGQLESIYHGVPILTIPITTEQAYNGQRVVSRGYGKMLNIQTFTPNELTSTINDIVANKAYKENTKQCSQILQDFPSAPEQVTFWTNHVLRFGGSHLKPVSIKMPFYKFLNLDVLFTIVIIIHIVLYLLYKILCTCFRCCCSKGGKIKKE